ncbi:MAG: TonB-dependent receptor [bacterium]
MRFNRILLGAFVTIAPISVPQIATAADADAAMETVVVTSRRQEESIQDVPMAVTAFTEADLERLAPKTIRDLDALVPNVRIGMVTAAPGQGALFIRGLGYADAENNQPPAVGIIIDGIYQGTNTGQLIDTFDIQQIEINRGPQGVLYGKNTTGGIIVVKRIKPVFNDFHYGVSATVGNYGEKQLKARINVPVIDDSLAFKLGVITKERDGYYKNITLGGDAGADDYTAITFSALYEPNDWCSGQFTYDNVDQSGDIPPQDPRWNGDNVHVNEADYDEFQELDVDSFGLQLSFDLGWGELETISGWVDSTDVTGQDFDGSTLESTASPLAQLHTHRDRDYEQFSQEIKLSGDLTDSLSYTVGYFYWDSEFSFQQGTNQVFALPSAAIGLPPGTPCSVAGLPSPALDPTLCQLPPAFTIQQTAEDVKSTALFAALNWQVTDTLELSVGARRVEEEKDFNAVYFAGLPPTDGPTNKFGLSINPPTESVGPPIVAEFGLGDEWSDTLIKVTADWVFAPNHSLYAVYSEGFQSGGIHNRSTDPEFAVFEPQSVESWELGLKNTFMDGRVILNLAAFQTTVADAQAASVIILPAGQPPGTNTIVNNIPADRDIWGYEVELKASVTDNVMLMFNYGKTEVDTSSYQMNSRTVAFNPTGSACNAFDNPGFFPNAPSSDGNTCPNVTFPGGEALFIPEFNMSFTAAYDRTFGGNDFHISVIARHQDDMNIAGSPPNSFIVEGAYTLLDARVAYNWNLQNGSTFTISAYGKNLTEEDYKEQILLLGVDGGFQGWGAPRTYSLEFAYSH